MEGKKRTQRSIHGNLKGNSLSGEKLTIRPQPKGKRVRLEGHRVRTSFIMKGKACEAIRAEKVQTGKRGSRENPGISGERHMSV